MSQGLFPYYITYIWRKGIRKFRKRNLVGNVSDDRASSWGGTRTICIKIQKINALLFLRWHHISQMYIYLRCTEGKRAWGKETKTDQLWKTKANKTNKSGVSSRKCWFSCLSLEGQLQFLSLIIYCQKTNVLFSFRYIQKDNLTFYYFCQLFVYLKYVMCPSPAKAANPAPLCSYWIWWLVSFTNLRSIFNFPFTNTNHTEPWPEYASILPLL